MRKSATQTEQAIQLVIHIHAITLGMTELDLREFDSVVSWLKWKRDMLSRERDALRKKYNGTDEQDH